MQSTQPLKVCSIYDTALDSQAMGESLMVYAQTRDEKLVKEKPGEQITWFHLRRIPNSLYQRFVAEATSELQRSKRAFQAAVIRIDHLVTTDGMSLQLVTPTEHVQTIGGDIECLSDKQMEVIPQAFIDDIGGVANARSFLPPKKELFFPLRGSLLAALEMRLSLDAAEIQMRARQSSAQPKELTPPSNGNGSAKPTDATATAEATSSSSTSTTNTSPDAGSSSTSSPVIVSTPAPGEPSTMPLSWMY